MLNAEQLVTQLLAVMRRRLVPSRWDDQRFDAVVGDLRQEFVDMWRPALASLPWGGFVTAEERPLWVGHRVQVDGREGVVEEIVKGGFKALVRVEGGEKILARGSDVRLVGPPQALVERLRRLPATTVDLLPSTDPGVRARLTREGASARVWLVRDELRQLDWETDRPAWAAEWENGLTRRTWQPRKQVAPPVSFGERMRANLEALRRVQAGPPYSDADVALLQRYTGFGGLSLKKIQSEIPTGLGPANRRALIDEYYTPVDVAEAIAGLVRPLLPELAGVTGRVLALEPAAGIGRLILPLELPSIDWVAVELSEWSSKILSGIAPDVAVYNSSFERFFRDNGPEYYGRVGLVVSNPPYSNVRGASEYDDPERSTRDLNAAEYFIYRATTMLKANGVGVFLVQHTVLDGADVRFRERLLKIAHLDVAFRLPSDLFPGAKLVVDVLVLRARGGALPEIDAADQYIVDGQYFKQTPEHVLGKEVRDGARRGYQVEGDFRGFPPYEPRSRCETCTVSPLKKPWVRTALAKRIDEEETPPEVLKAASLGSRVDAYGQRQARGEFLDPGAWEVLSRELQEWSTNFGNPWTNDDLAARAERDKDLARFRALYTRGGLLSTEWLTPPKEQVQTGLRDFLEICQHLWRNSREVSIPKALRMHAELGLGALTMEQVEQLLEAAEWAVDGSAWDRAMPIEHYLTGDLWRRVDNARQKNNALAQRQIGKLMKVIAPYPFEEISELTPKFEWVSEDLRSQWVSRIVDQEVRVISTDNGYVYENEPKPTTLNRSDVKQLLLGWFNEDMDVFKPAKRLAQEYGVDLSKYELEEVEEQGSKSEREALPSVTQAIREAMQAYWLEDFRLWVAGDPERKASITELYNRSFRGFAVPEYPREFPLPVAWSSERRPHWWQFQGAARFLDQRGGLCAYDVGLGKTITAILTIAKGKEAGMMRRPVVVVPNTVVWQWVAEFSRSVPSFRVGVVGSKLKRVVRQGREVLVDERDTPEERARKWIAFQRGVYDVMVCAATAFPRVAVDLDELTEYYEELRDFRRLLRDEQEALGKLKKKLEKEAKQAPKGADAPPEEVDEDEDEDEEEEVELGDGDDEGDGKKKPRRWTERDEAIMAEGVAGFLRALNELPPGQREDPGVIWNRLGVDGLFVDEAQRYKELFTPPAIDGRIPKFMGSAQKSSKRAWQLDARAAVVRLSQGGTGVYLLSATPAKNSPLELYNLIRYVDNDAFRSRGILTHLGFVERFCDFSYVWTVSVKLKEEALLALTGFKNLDELRAVLFRYSAFYTAEQVGLKLPKPAVRTITVEMDDEQQELYRTLRSLLREAISARKRNKILSIMANMDLIALHPDLFRKVGEGKNVRPFWTWKNAGEQQFPESSKLVRVAQQIASNNTCQHLVFLENLAAQRWLLETLVKRGIPRDQIAIMNARTAPRPAQRQRLALAFTGTDAIGENEPEIPPSIRVLIVNSVAYEGIDLQRRTCALHHVDLPWTPATVQQRNGRGVRQGNREDVVEIIYYLAEKSMDALHFAAITGKIGWMEVLIAGSDRATNNPAAQQGDSISALTLVMDDDKADFEALRRRMRAEEEVKRVETFLKNLDRRVGGIRGRVEQAQETSDPVEAARLRDEARRQFEQLLAEATVRVPRVAAELQRAERVLWTRPVYAAGGLLVWPGRFFRHSSGNVWEAGYLTEDELAYRQVGRAEWKNANLARVFGEPSVELLDKSGNPIKVVDQQPIPVVVFPFAEEDVDPKPEENLGDVLVRWVDQQLSPDADWQKLTWAAASDEFRKMSWQLVGQRVIQKVRAYAGRALPAVRSARLVLVTGDELDGVDVLPWTVEAWERAMRLPVDEDVKLGEVWETSALYWGRPFRRVRAVRRATATPATPATPAPATPPTPPVDNSPEAATAAAMRYPQEARAVHEQDPQAVRALNAMVAKLLRYLDVEPLRSGHGYRGVRLRSRRTDGIFEALPVGTVLAEVNLLHDRPPEGVDFEDLARRLRELGRPVEQLQNVKRYVLDLVRNMSEAARQEFPRRETSAPSSPSSPPSNLGTYFQIGDTFYGDTRLIDALARKGLSVQHLGFGDFRLTNNAGGHVDFTRTGEELPGQQGRLHRLDAMKVDLKELLPTLDGARSGGRWASLEAARASSTSTPASPPTPTPSSASSPTPSSADTWETAGAEYDVEEHPVLRTAEERLRARGFGVTRSGKRLEVYKDGVSVGLVFWAGRLRLEKSRPAKGAEEFHAKLVSEVEGELQRCCDY